MLQMPSINIFKHLLSDIVMARHSTKLLIELYLFETINYIS